MTHEISRRKMLTLATGTVLAASSNASLLAGGLPSRALDYDTSLRPLTSRSGVFTPARGESVMQFGFDFPEPSARIGEYLFGFRIQTFENVYTIDPATVRMTPTASGVELVADGVLTSGGQERGIGRVTVNFGRAGETGIEWRIRATLGRPIKSITTVVRGLPRGALSVSAGDFRDHGDDEKVFEYPQLFGGMSTPFVMLKAADGRLFELAARQEAVRPARFFFQPGPEGLRVELIHEHAGWSPSAVVETGLWRVGPAESFEAAASAHFAHVERTYAIPRWSSRSDVPSWMRDARLVLSLHGAHWTGYIFNDYARMLEILGWVATEIDARQVMVFLPAWDGRYYWNYPRYEPDPRMGGEKGFARLIGEGQKLGFHLVPMFGANSANRTLPDFSHFADASTRHVDGDAFDLNWVDWDNDRRNEGWMPFMNLAVPSWRHWLTQRISSIISRFGVDGYFLDIAGAWENNRQGDMYLGTKELVSALRVRHPGALPVGEMLYDAQMADIPVSQVVRYSQFPKGQDAYVRNFQHLSHGAPGRGSTGVHEAGFGNYEATVRDSQRAIPTLTVVDDTFTRYRSNMRDYIALAKSWSPPGAA